MANVLLRLCCCDMCICFSEQWNCVPVVLWGKCLFFSAGGYLESNGQFHVFWGVGKVKSESSGKVVKLGSGC